MKKSTRKIINSLRKYIGHEIIRTRKTVTGYWGYTDQPILLVGFTSDGRIRYRYLGSDAIIFGNKEFILPLDFTDRNWITYKKALKAKHNELNKWRGKKIKRIRPTSTYNDDYSFMCRGNSNKAPTLISASKYHMVIRYNDGGLLKGKTTVLPSYFMNPEDWVLAE